MSDHGWRHAFCSAAHSTGNRALGSTEQLRALLSQAQGSLTPTFQADPIQGIWDEHAINRCALAHVQESRGGLQSVQLGKQAQIVKHKRCNGNRATPRTGHRRSRRLGWQSRCCSPVTVTGIYRYKCWDAYCGRPSSSAVTVVAPVNAAPTGSRYHRTRGGCYGSGAGGCAFD